MPRRLLIVDHYESPAFDRAASASGPDDEWDVFLLGGSPEWFRWRHPERATRLRGCRLLDPAEFAAEAHALVSEFVVALGATLPRMSLGGQSLADLLAGPDGTTWWYLETSEKGAYRGPLIGQLYRLALARLVTRHGGWSEVWFSIRERALAGLMTSGSVAGQSWVMTEAAAELRDPRFEHRPFVRLCLQAVRAFGRFVSARAFCATLADIPPAEPTPTGRWIFTVFPSWWSRASTATPSDRFFTNVADAHFDGYFAWLSEPHLLWRHARAVRQAVRTLKLVPLQRFLSFLDGVSVFSPRRFWRLWRFETAMRPRLLLEFAGFPVGSIVGHDISVSLSGYEPIQDDLLARAMAKVADRFAPRLVLYRAEFQPIEAAVARGLSGRAAAIGYQHHPFGRNYLQMRFAPAEVAEYVRRPRTPAARPLPDGMIAIGPVLKDHVADGGFPADRITVCGAQRYGPLIEYRQHQEPVRALRNRLDVSPDDFVVFVALAIVESDTEALFGALVEACREMTNLRLIVRTHPNRPDGDPALHATLDALGRTRAQLMPASGRMYDYIAAADCMVCVGSMIAFEAMALGVMPIVVDNPSFFGAISLAEYEEGLFVVRNAGDMRRAIEDVRTGAGGAPLKRQAWLAVLRRVLGDLERPLGHQMDEALDAFDTPPAVKRTDGQQSVRRNDWNRDA